MQGDTVVSVQNSHLRDRLSENPLGNYGSKCSDRKLNAEKTQRIQEMRGTRYKRHLCMSLGSLLCTSSAA